MTDALDIDYRVVLSADDHLGNGRRSKRPTILGECDGEVRGRGRGEWTYLVAETAHAGAEGVLYDLEGVVPGDG